MRVMMELKEDLNKKIDNTHKSMDTLNSKIEDSGRALREELNTTLTKISQKMDEMNKKYTEEVGQTTREELQREDEVERAEKEGDSNALLTENELDRNQEDIHDKEIDTGSIENTQVIKEAEELVAEKEELEQNDLPMCDDQVEIKELPRNKNTEQVNSKIKIHEERNKIIKKTEEKEAKIRRIIRPKKTRVAKELIEMTRSGLINMIYFPIVDREEGIYRKEYRSCLLYTSRCV